MTKLNAIFFRERHPFHILPASILPFFVSLSLFILLFTLVGYFHDWNVFGFVSNETTIHFSFLLLWCSIFSWVLDVLEEGALGFHTKRVQQGLKYGFALFIFSEIMFFFAFFWAFFHYSLVPSIYIGDIWPPYGTQPIDVWYLPLINTILLLLSGFTITRAHMILLSEPTGKKVFNLGIKTVFNTPWRVHPADHVIGQKRNDFPSESYEVIISELQKYHFKEVPYGFLFTTQRFLIYLWCTIVFGLTFLWVQGLEYKYGVKFSWRGNIYGSIFFLLTGFHGFHVTVGLFFLFFCFIVQNFAVRFMIADVANDSLESKIPAEYVDNFMRSYKLTFYALKTFCSGYPLFFQHPRLFLFTKEQHVGFEVSAWYWHFVDVVWLFLFISVYWWGSSIGPLNIE